eukprot:scaffold277969_cov32-Tisochrysis_lutea.AAC.1
MRQLQLQMFLFDVAPDPRAPYGACAMRPFAAAAAGSALCISFPRGPVIPLSVTRHPPRSAPSVKNP